MKVASDVMKMYETLQKEKLNENPRKDTQIKPLDLDEKQAEIKPEIEEKPAKKKVKRVTKRNLKISKAEDDPFRFLKMSKSNDDSFRFA